MVKRGEVWLARLDPTEGKEIRKTRPCMIISPSEIHDHLDIVLVAPMTTGSRLAGYRIPIHFSGKDGLILLDQIRTMDQKRLIRRLGTVEPHVLLSTLRALQSMFAP
jgi:mRNA interferase MazF